jgi:hypothetical protein
MWGSSLRKDSEASASSTTMIAAHLLLTICVLGALVSFEGTLGCWIEFDDILLKLPSKWFG